MFRKLFIAASLSLALVSPLVAQTGGTGNAAANTAAVLGTTADSPYAGSGNATIDAVLKGIYANSATFFDTRPASGSITIQDTGSASATGQDSVSIITGTPTASSFRTAAVNGQGTIGVQLSGTWTGTITTEQSRDGGATWGTMPCHVNGAVYSRTSFTGNGMFNCVAAGATNIRARATAAMTGTATVLFTASSAPGYVETINSSALKDNTSGAQATIKPASTAAGAADPAIVVVVSPNNAVALATSGYTASASITRTNDTNAYLANDIIGAATGSTAGVQFSSIGASGGDIVITSVEMEIDAASIISGETSYNLYLYNVTPPSALGDNAAFDIPSGDRASFVGKIALGSPVDEGSTLYIRTDGVNAHVKLSSANLFGYLVTVGAYTPTASRVYKVTLHAAGL